ncbi:MAG TPA: tetratricopeptide repeat protein [Anaeromyxobacteraceae bacterium]|nr:tetratricopeptide repeat protein [Anaeromyxobacteraceae bacterium]
MSAAREPRRMSPRRAPAPGLLVALAALCACAGPRGPGAEAVRFPPEEIVASAELAGKNEAELQAIGTAAYGAGDFRRAAAALGRLADAFPASPHAAAALHDAGRAHQRLGEWRAALERFRALASRGDAPAGAGVSFRLAECHYHLGELAEARALLDGVAARKDLAAGERVRALAQRGVVELEAGHAEEAERSLRLALATWQAASERERLDPYPAAQAEYHLGEVYRLGTEAVRLAPDSADPEGLARDLEEKAQLLLSAQGHYLRAIRLGEPEWAVAAGYRIGELYERLHAEIDAAPLPPGLGEEEAALYRAELSDRIRVLVGKAIALYEQTLAAAQRAGVDNRFVEEAERALGRLRALAAP